MSRASREVPSLGDWVLDKGTPLSGDPSQAHEHLLAAIEQLPEHQRDLIEAVFWERLTYWELAHRLGLKAKQSAYDRVQRALEALAVILNEEHYDIEGDKT